MNRNSTYHRLKHVPEFKALQGWRSELIQKKKVSFTWGRTLAEVQAHFDAAQIAYKKWKAENPDQFLKRPKKPPGEKKVRTKKIDPRTPEQIESARQLQSQNVFIGEQRKIARAEYNEFMAQWTKKWAHLGYGKRKEGKKKGWKRRADLIQATKNPKEARAMKRQIDLIMNQPCSCYWCGTKLRYGTVDHIIPLAKGGKHIASNICAACYDCNAKKSDRTPEEAGLEATLL